MTSWHSGEVPTLLLVRHGRTAANASGTLAGWTPGVGLDEVGVAQARALGERLAGLPVALVAVSPLQRCQETADELSAAAGWSGVRRVTTDDLGECRYGAWTGRPLAELAGEELWRTVQDHPSRARFPQDERGAGGEDAVAGAPFPAESIADMAHRVVAAVRDLDRLVGSEHGPEALWVAVSHGDPIKAVLADAAGTHLDHFQRIVAGPASVSVLRYTATRPFLVRVNDTGADLASLAPAAGGSRETDAPSGDAVVGGGTA